MAGKGLNFKELSKNNKIKSYNEASAKSHKLLGNAERYQEYTQKRSGVHLDNKPLSKSSWYKGDDGISRKSNIHKDPQAMQRLAVKEQKTASKLLDKDISDHRAIRAASAATKKAVVGGALRAAGTLGTAYAVGQAVGTGIVAGKKAYSNYKEDKETKRLGKVAKKLGK